MFIVHSYTLSGKAEKIIFFIKDPFPGFIGYLFTAVHRCLIEDSLWQDHGE